jgi:hypothetical protein
MIDMAWNRSLLRNKFRALSIHLGISALIFLPILYLLWFRWFPAPLFFTDGGWQGLRIMLFVDLTIGPSLTFLVFNPAKSRRELAFDFSFIALVQAAALIYGAYNVEQKRQWVMSLHDGVFHAVTLDSFQSQKVPPENWSKFGSQPLYWVFAREPQSQEEIGGAGVFKHLEGIEPYQLEFLYEPLAQHPDAIKQAALDLAKGTGDTEMNERLRKYQSQHPEALYFVRHEGYFRNAMLIFDAQYHYIDAIYASAQQAHKN